MAESIRRSPTRGGGVRLVAVDGPGGAGKSVFASRLAKTLGGVSVVHTDDFASWDNPHDWWDRLEEVVLGPLERGDAVRFQASDWVANRLGEWRDIPTTDVVIVEGVSSSRLAVADRLAMAIWIETPRDKRMTRGIARDGASMRPAWEAWMAEEEAHFALDRTRDRAALIVDGSPSVPHDPEHEFVVIETDSRPA